jgi:CHAD domain-containing protein
VGNVLINPLVDRAGKLERVLAQVATDEPDSVHQLRVTGRRLNLVLWILDRSPAGGRDPGPQITMLRDEVRWLTSVAARARDLEVIAAQLDESTAKVALAERADEVARLLVVLKNSPADRLPGRLHDFAAGLKTREVDKAATKTVQRVVVRCDRELRRSLGALEDTPPSDAALHAVRKTMRRARYVAEIAAPALGNDVAAYSVALADCQENLGTHQDASVALAWLHGRRADLDIDPLLVQRLTRAQQRARGQFAVTKVPSLPRLSH